MSQVKIFTKKSPFVIDEPDVDSDADSDGESDVLSDSSNDERGNDYDFNDGFLIPDDNENTSSAENENKNSTDDNLIEFEQRRAKAAIDEVYLLKKKIKTLERKLNEMTDKRRKWRKRAKKMYAYAERLEQQLEQQSTCDIKTN